jgi:hypothetical protein
MRMTIIDTAFSKAATATTKQIAEMCGTTAGNAKRAVSIAKKTGKIVEVGKVDRNGKPGRQVLVYSLNQERAQALQQERSSRTWPRLSPAEHGPASAPSLVGQAIANRTALEVAWNAR